MANPLPSSGAIPGTQQGLPVQMPPQQAALQGNVPGTNQALAMAQQAQLQAQAGGGYGTMPTQNPNGQNAAFNDFLLKNPAARTGMLRFLPANTMAGIHKTFGPKALVHESVGYRRRTLNWIPFIFGMTVPWLVFTTSMVLNGFRPQDLMPNFVRIGNFVVVFLVANYSYSVHKNRRAYDVKFVIVLMVLFYLLLGWLLGSLLYWFRMQPYYQLVGMASYKGVNPSRFKTLTMTIGSSQKGSVSAANGYTFTLVDSGRAASSQRYQDAGQLWFDSPTVSVDVTRAMSFRDGDTYCVAPIVDSQCDSATMECGVEFWAVGINCCGGQGDQSFTCDLKGNTPADRQRTAVRWVEPQAVSFFRLAVAQAEGMHKMQSPHPIFFQFYSRGENPSQIVAELARGAYRRLFAASVFSFFINCVFMAYMAKRLVHDPKNSKRNRLF